MPQLERQQVEQLSRVCPGWSQVRSPRGPFASCSFSMYYGTNIEGRAPQKSHAGRCAQDVPCGREDVGIEGGKGI